MNLSFKDRGLLMVAESAKRKLVIVEWDDAAGAPDDKLGWITIDEAIKCVGLVRIMSVGWIIRDDLEAMVLIPNITSDESCDSPTVIPKSCIVWMKELK